MIKNPQLQPGTSETVMETIVRKPAYQIELDRILEDNIKPRQKPTVGFNSDTRLDYQLNKIRKVKRLMTNSY